MKKKINLRLIFIAVLAVVAVTVSLTFVYYGMLKKQVMNDLVSAAGLLKDTRYFEQTDVDLSSMDFSPDAGNLRITWVASDGTVLYDNDNAATEMENHLTRPEIQEAFQTGSGTSIRQSNTMGMNTYYYAVLLENQSVLRVAMEARNITSMFSSTVPMVLVIMVVVIMICILLSHLLTRQLIEPIEELAEKIEDTNVETPYKELVPFHNMIRRQHTDILESAKMRQDFTANVSHELKTPLTAISGYAELIQNGMVGKEEENHFLQEIRNNADRLLTLINDIIRLSELDHTDKMSDFEEIDLYRVVADCIEPLKVSAAKRKVELDFEGETTLVFANKDMIRELTDNLVQNAIRYNKEGGRVWVSVREESGEKLLTVRDNGIGIPAEDQKRVFERFYRVDKSRSKATGGTGLGLAIVKHIAEIHDARIEMISFPGAGTTMKVHFH